MWCTGERGVSEPPSLDNFNRTCRAQTAFENASPQLPANASNTASRADRGGAPRFHGVAPAFRSLSQIVVYTASDSGGSEYQRTNRRSWREECALKTSAATAMRLASSSASAPHRPIGAEVRDPW